ncbi:hypothetical protein OHB26_39265 (plasmid) [Nocardia sp. NBC_01503]|uniref:hypothetical protein n=1 Tax=Nocardia sp. NBC_01503 TaxID=2975997 RepID=UPI002E7B714A|nr:hypothetical protein [Nocardia sp. NBC_01503]WTL36719.1 hypothetical protein OHB26_39265 [Nocardia sp. NBC_01503]
MTEIVTDLGTIRTGDRFRDARKDNIRTLEVLRFPNELRAELAVVSVEYRGQVTEPKDRTTRMEIARLLGRNFVRIEKAQVR